MLNVQKQSVEQMFWWFAVRFKTITDIYWHIQFDQLAIMVEIRRAMKPSIRLYNHNKSMHYYCINGKSRY